MKNVTVKDERAGDPASIVTLFVGSGVAVLLLLGIFGGYLLGALVLFGTLALLPVIALATLMHRLLQGKAPVLVRTPSVLQPAQATTSPMLTVGELRSVDIFKDLSDRELKLIAAIGRVIKLPPGTLLAKQGEPASRVYAVLEGQVELTASSPQGEITVRVAGPGESLPLAALLGSGTLITTANAMSDLTVVEISHEALHNLMAREPVIGMRVYQAVADILGKRYQSTLNRMVGSMDQALRQADVFANV